MAITRDYSVTEDDVVAVEVGPDGDESSQAGDFAPEGVTFAPAEDSPVANPLLCVGYGVSGTVGVFEVTPETGTCGVSTRSCAASRRRASDARPPSVGDRFGWTRRDLTPHGPAASDDIGRKESRVVTLALLVAAVGEDLDVDVPFVLERRRPLVVGLRLVLVDGALRRPVCRVVVAHSTRP